MMTYFPAMTPGIFSQNIVLGHAIPQESHELTHPVIDVLPGVGAVKTRAAGKAKADIIEGVKYCIARIIGKTETNQSCYDLGIAHPDRSRQDHKPLYISRTASPRSARALLLHLQLREQRAGSYCLPKCAGGKRFEVVGRNIRRHINP